MILIPFLLVSSCYGKTLLEEINTNPSLSKAAAIIENSPFIKAMIENSPVALFLPNDEAMDRYEGPKDEEFLKYHLVNVPYLVQDLPSEIPTALGGNPRVYVTKFPTGLPSINGWEHQEYYVNNAKVVGRNIQSDSRKQVLHILDEAMNPTRKVDGSIAYAYPKADDLLKDAYNYGYSDKKSLKKFQRRVSELGAMDVFGIEGKNTFFIPVDNGLVNGKIESQEMIDKPVIHGHIIPQKAIFTRTFRDTDEQYESYAFTDNLKVFITMENVSSADNNEISYYVKSHVVAGDQSHQKGTALARILIGNIPVTNGVVHLIDRPLMVVASSIISYLQGENLEEEETLMKDGQLSKFHYLMKERYPDLSNLLVVQNDLTLFAPSNYAFDMVNKDRLHQIEGNHVKLGNLLRLHIVRKRLTTDEIINKSMKQAETINDRRKLYFAVNNPDAPMPKVSLEGGGVNATITTPNIATKNGVIHIIDRILGIPSQTVYEKLASDPMLSRTFEFSKQKEWANKFKDRDGSFTVFAPSNDAWKYIETNSPSTYKKIKMGEFPNHVIAILERHIIAHKELKLNQLVALTNNNATKMDRVQQKDLTMTRGKVYFQARAIETYGEMRDEYYLDWNGQSAKVKRPDVECVNGVVHVIDKVLMMKRDMTVNAAVTGDRVSMPLIVLASVLTYFTAKTFH